MDTRKEIPKWEFGSAPISVKMQGRYNYAVQSMIDFLEGNTTIEEIEPDQISELKGMFNRCLRKDQWDWLSVFACFGSPKRESLRPLIPLLIDLRRSVISGETQIVGSISQKLLQLDLLKLLRTFQDVSSSQSNNTENLTREEAARRIGEAAEKKLTELDLSGLSLTQNPALAKLDAEYQKIESEEYFDAETLQDARRRTTTSIVQRQGQTEFRRKLLTAYGGRCPITDCDVESAIEAAHIIPYQGTQTNHPTNGLPLRADIHTLFDLHLLSIRPNTNEVVIAPELVGTCYQYLADRQLTLPHDQKAAPNQSALSKHYETFLNKCKISKFNVYKP